MGEAVLIDAALGVYVIKTAGACVVIGSTVATPAVGSIAGLICGGAAIFSLDVIDDQYSLSPIDHYLASTAPRCLNLEYDELILISPEPVMEPYCGYGCANENPWLSEQNPFYIPPIPTPSCNGYSCLNNSYEFIPTPWQPNRVSK